MSIASAHPFAVTEPVTTESPPAPAGGAPVPEATTLLLVGTGLVGVALTRRRRRESR